MRTISSTRPRPTPKANLQMVDATLTSLTTSMLSGMEASTKVSSTTVFHLATGPTPTNLLSTSTRETTLQTFASRTFSPNTTTTPMTPQPAQLLLYVPEPQALPIQSPVTSLSSVVTETSGTVAKWATGVPQTSPVAMITCLESTCQPPAHQIAQPLQLPISSTTFNEH